MQMEPIAKPSATMIPETEELLQSLSFKVVGVKDLLLFKMLKGNDVGDYKKKGVDFVSLRNLLQKQCLESPEDPCLLHNKAVLYAYKHHDEASLEIFEHLGADEVALETLEHGWQINWAIVLLRTGDHTSLARMLQ